MVEGLDRILNIINLYIDKLYNHGIHVSKAYLYGSFAKGKPHEFSDIDLGLISEDFTGDWFDDRRKIVPLRRQIDERLEPMPFLPEDFHAGNPLAAEIIAYGIEIDLNEIQTSNRQSLPDKV